MMRFAMCNEFCEGMPLADVFALAADCGYDGVELAPFTIAADAREISADQRREIRGLAAAKALEIVGLHWLLVSPAGLYTNHPEAAIREQTRQYFEALIHLCADLGGNRLIIGSPKQRNVVGGETYEATWARTVDFYRALTSLAAEREVLLCIEPLARSETNFLNTKADAVRLIEAVDHSQFRLILDCKAMSDEGRPLPDIIREAAPYLAHFHANDTNLSYPGSGDVDFAPIMAALREIDYRDWVSIEVFDFSPGPERIARDGLACLKAALSS